MDRSIDRGLTRGPLIDFNNPEGGYLSREIGARAVKEAQILGVRLRGYRDKLGSTSVFLAGGITGLGSLGYAPFGALFGGAAFFLLTNKRDSLLKRGVITLVGAALGGVIFPVVASR